MRGSGKVGKRDGGGGLDSPKRLVRRFRIQHFDREKVGLFLARDVNYGAGALNDSIAVPMSGYSTLLPRTANDCVS